MGGASNYARVCGFQSGDLVSSGSLASRNNSSGMAHSSARWCGDTRNEGDNRLLNAVVFEEMCGLLFSLSANLADHNDTLCFLVVEKHVKTVDEIGSVEGIAANSNANALPQANLSGLIDGLVGEGSRSRHDADGASLVNVAGHDANLTLLRFNNARTVGADESGGGGVIQEGLDADHIALGDSLGDGDDEGHFGANGLFNGGGGGGGRDEDDGGICGGLGAGLFDSGEDGAIQMGLTGALRVGAADDIGAVRNGLLGVEGALLAGEALEEDAGGGVDERGRSGGQVPDCGGGHGGGWMAVDVGVGTWG